MAGLYRPSSRSARPKESVPSSRSRTFLKGWCSEEFIIAVIFLTSFRLYRRVSLRPNQDKRSPPSCSCVIHAPMCRFLGTSTRYPRTPRLLLPCVLSCPPQQYLT